MRICALATALPLFATKYLPFCDLPEHVAAIATFRHWFDPAWRLQEYYSLAFDRSQYLAYHLAGALLAVPLGSAERANLALLSVTAVSYPYAARALLRAFGRDERLAVFACSAFWSRSLVVGFLPYVASVPVVLYGLSLVARQARAPTTGRAVALGAVSVLLFFLHGNAFLFFVVCAPVSTWMLRRARFGASATEHELWWLPWRFAWLMPSLVIAGVWMSRGSLAVRGRSLGDVDQTRHLPLGELPHELPVWAHDTWRSHADEGVAIATWILFALLVIQRGRVREGLWSVLASWAPFVVAAVLFLILPFQLGAGGMVNVRFALFLPVLVLLVLRPRADLRGTIPILCGAALSLVTASTAAWEMRRAARDEVGDCDRILDVPRPGTRLVSLVFHATSEASDFAAWVHLGSYHRARHGGVAAPSFSDLPHWPVHYREAAAPPPKVAFWEFNPCLYRNEVDGAYYDYVLVRGNVDPFRDEPPGPRWHALVREKDWTLYEKTPGEWAPKWAREDMGPCESRRSVEAEPR